MWTPVPATDPAIAPHPTFTTLRLAGLKLAEKMPAMPELLCPGGANAPGAKRAEQCGSKTEDAPRSRPSLYLTAAVLPSRP